MPASSSSSLASAHPGQDFTTIVQLALKSLNLALLHQALLDSRLPAGTVPNLISDLDRLGVVVPGARQVRHESKVATADQDAALRAGYARIKAVRTAVKKARASKEVRQAYGVGVLVNRVVVRDVKAMLQQILDRAAKNPGEAAGLGILPKDVEAIAAAHQAITDADKVQEHKRATAPLSTQERNRTANRIIEAIGRIAGAGGLEFADDADELAKFQALKLPPKSKKGVAKKAPVAAEPAPAVSA